jgi:hypothetical protein
MMARSGFSGSGLITAGKMGRTLSVWPPRARDRNFFMGNRVLLCGGPILFLQKM